MASLGDIVTIGAGAEHWAVMGFEPSPRGWPLQVRLSRFDHEVFDGKVPVQFVVGGPEALVTVLEPAFEPGDFVRHNGHSAEVIADNGITVRISHDVDRGLPIGGTVTKTMEVDRGSLALANIHRLLQQQG